ncbi:helix-turn-helix transcriptional regulator [Olivibacter sp. SDN3]|uniref:AraC family transcriptional regulator n=1 Tax=Olivibacter sp. SDN3 TaxID=2764720 RepID=UPI0016511760|nr:AraC family transcriptional regulator [Olivibacter sp. SDN3]QNL48658.1 helix-turn-helix transcriptional regulator [Olivibacter sp. SDN3]
MKAKQLIVPHNASSSFSIRKEQLPNINNKWHCHVEMELIHFHRGSGTQFVGDHVKRFSAGDVVLVGTNLPHYWRFDQETISNNPKPYSTVLHFNEDFIGDRWKIAPESKMIQSLFRKADQGVLITGKSAAKVAEHLEAIYEAESFQRILCLLQCLHEISLMKELKLLSSLGFEYKNTRVETNRLNDIYTFTLNNFRNKISLEDIAAVADLVPSSFCRYFKHHSGKTYTQFLQDIRIGYACKLLLEDKNSLKQICYDSGFSNYTSFHEIFKSVTGKTPREYKAQHQAL